MIRWRDGPSDLGVDLIEARPDPLPGRDAAVPSGPSDPAVAAQRNQLRQVLHKTINRMPPAWREAVWLHHLDGFDPAEIVALQHLNEQQVRDNLRQAVAGLRNALHAPRDRQG